LGGVGLAIEDAVMIKGSGVVGEDLAKWVVFEGPSPWVDWSFAWGTANFGSNWSFGQPCWATVKDRGCCLDSSKIR